MHPNKKKPEKSWRFIWNVLSFYSKALVSGNSIGFSGLVNPPNCCKCFNAYEKTPVNARTCSQDFFFMQPKGLEDVFMISLIL